MLAPPPLAILTMRPQRRAIIPGKARWAHRIWPCRFTSIVRHHAPTSLSAKGPSGPTTPALLTSRSIGPSARSTSVKAWSTAMLSITSVGKALTLPPDRSISATVSAARLPSAPGRRRRTRPPPAPGRSPLQRHDPENEGEGAAADAQIDAGQPLRCAETLQHRDPVAEQAGRD